MLNKEMEGKTYPPFNYTIERTKVREFCLALGETNTLFTDPETARAAGYRDTPIPLTFYSAVDMWGSCERAWEILADVGIDVKKMLDLKKEYEYYTPVYAGDNLTVKMMVESLFENSLIEKAVFKSVYYRDGEKTAVGRLTVGIIK